MSSQAPGNRQRGGSIPAVSSQPSIRAESVGYNAKPCASALSCAGRADVAVDGCVERLHGQAGESDIEMQRTILAGRLLGYLYAGWRARVENAAIHRE